MLSIRPNCEHCDVDLPVHLNARFAQTVSRMY